MVRQMIHLSSDLEKELWRKAAIAALKSVEEVNATGHKEALQYAILVADGVVRNYRARCESNA